MRAPLRLEEGDFERIRVEHRDGGVVVLTLNRPEKMNAIDDVLHRELSQLPRAIQQDARVRCAVITGEGANFCSGGDISLGSYYKTIQTTAYDLFLEARQLVTDFVDLDKPVVCGVRGYALGLGCTLALCCDVVIASESAKFGDPHVWNLAVTAGDGCAVLWPMLVGPQRAKYYLLTGEYLPAAEAVQFGLAHRVVGEELLMDEVLRIARRLADGPPLAIRSTKAIIQRYVSLFVNEILPCSLATEGFVVDTDDAREAMTAWSERRPPEFTGTDARYREANE